MAGRPLVSVVVLNYNGARYLEECLESLERQTYRPVEILLVDNGSTDGSPEMAGRFAGVRLFRLPENVGFAAGNNFAFGAAAGVHVALLNNDAAAAPDWIESLVAAADTHPEFGMFASRILLADDPGTIDKAGHVMYWDGQNKGRGSGDRDGSLFDSPREVFFPDGCAALYRRDLLDDVGGFDERFFAYGDDADLGIRARLRGWRAYYVPEARVWHRHSSTAGLYSTQKIFWVERNRFWLAVKTFPPLLLALSPLFTANRFGWNLVYALLGRGAAGRFRQGHSAFRILRTLGAAYADGFRKIAPMWRERRRIRRTRRLSDREFFGLMRRFGISARDLASRD